MRLNKNILFLNTELLRTFFCCNCYKKTHMLGGGELEIVGHRLLIIYPIKAVEMSLKKQVFSSYKKT